MYCRNCGEQINENAIVCVKCGTEKTKGSNYCANCGEKVEAGQIACMGCGYALPKEKKSFKEIIGKYKKVIIPCAIVLVLAIVAIFAIPAITNNKKDEIDFKAIYDEFCEYPWAEVADDGSYLSLDSNPYDYDDNPFYCVEAYNVIEDINKALGLPASLKKAIGETSPSDGRQTERYEELGIEVTWKYSQDYGMELTYKKI